MCQVSAKDVEDNSEVSTYIFFTEFCMDVFNISFQGAEVWNDISGDIKLLSLKRFKKKLKSILIDIRSRLLVNINHNVSSLW